MRSSILQGGSSPSESYHLARLRRRGIQDATTSANSVRQLLSDPLGVPIIRSDRIEEPQQQPIWQILCDDGRPSLVKGSESARYRAGVTRSRKPEVVAAFTSRLIRSLPSHMKPAGVICHSNHKKAIREACDSGDLAMIEHFHGVLTRGSNEWPKYCNSLIVVGTPRIIPQLIEERAIGYREWGDGPFDEKSREFVIRYWYGRDIDGNLIPHGYLSYRDRRMDLAYRDLVISEVRQAIGRARIYTAEGTVDPRSGEVYRGIPAIFVGNEPVQLWDPDVGYYGETRSIMVPGGNFLLSRPEILECHGEVLKASTLVNRGMSERAARTAIEGINRAGKAPGTRLGWARQREKNVKNEVFLPWNTPESGGAGASRGEKNAVSPITTIY